ncbi:unnamed protein product [Prunus armeniaca]|uniref:Uncharacterized protein n=1 Tax=Prunus armeniaca TaxID=36596 RepID=A0A6J5VYX6_PRUAR|nr:unnamed protein product [Prunus armeniaca]CAB4294500.1 unnamed protein product [Prunus armeniaca]
MHLNRILEKWQGMLALVRAVLLLRSVLAILAVHLLAAADCGWLLTFPIKV